MPDERLISLLGCLNKLPGSLRLECPLVAEDPSALENTPFPFVTVTDTDPWARLLEGRISTEAGSLLKEVFLLVQRDRYLAGRDPLRPLTNRDMEEAWQKTHRAYAKDGSSPAIDILPPGADPAGPLPPLMFCTRTRFFFAPPCPRCGLPLQQCEDDDLLIALGLQPYASSLRRYLYCPDCAGTGLPVFYAFERESSDPPVVRDRSSLIGDFARIAGQRAGASRFPCPECPEQGVCYGPAAAALARIVPFSFYPFHLLITEAAHLSGLDFLALAGGASFEELEKALRKRGEGWRAAAVARLKKECGGQVPFASPEPGRRFFEALFIKLSFLSECYHHLMSSPDAFPGSTGGGFSADRLWVRLGEPGELLPFLWNFRLRVAGLREDPSEVDTLPGLPASNGFVSLGLLWFCALLANGSQDMGKVLNSLKEAVRRRTLAAPMPDEDVFTGEGNPFSPANIFWQPGSVTPQSSWRDSWERALGLGWTLLRSAVAWDEQWLRADLGQHLASLREEVRKALFPAGPVQAAETALSEPSGGPEEIRDVLTRIAGKWRAGLEAEKAELAETVILSAAALAAVPAEASPAGPPVGEPLAETVVLGPGGVVPAGTGRVAASSPPEAERAAPTPSEVPPGPGAAPPPKPSADDFLAETVIISRGSRQSPPLTPPPQATATAAEGAAEPGTDAPVKPVKKAGADDGLAETVIIDAARLRPRKE